MSAAPPLAGPSPAEALAADLRHRLRGPLRVRRDMLQEVRDGLQDATAALVAEGLTPAEAEARAVAEFGAPEEVAGELQRELAARQARWTAAVGTLVLTSLWLAWDVAWRTAPVPGRAPEVVGLLSRLTDAFGLSAAALCLAALLVLQVRGSRLRQPERLARAVGGTTLAALVATVTTSVVMSALNPEARALLVRSQPGFAIATALTVVLVTALSTSARRCLQAAAVERSRRPAAGGPAHPGR
ncbi:permease prefix domain 1-containing protein [Kineococcus glutinatus]|uniref:Uncharacterized protein n=1 Tax=Kineococcus glutinatus TaxID=1070872 RepID=A0ABP9H5M5_9ACTN